MRGTLLGCICGVNQLDGVVLIIVNHEGHSLLLCTPLVEVDVLCGILIIVEADHIVVEGALSKGILRVVLCVAQPLICVVLSLLLFFHCYLKNGLLRDAVYLLDVESCLLISVWLLTLPWDLSNISKRGALLSVSRLRYNVLLHNNILTIVLLLGLEDQCIMLG